MTAAAGLPEAAREPFLAGMTQAASGGIEIGAGQAAGTLPAGVPADVAAQIQAAIQHTFSAAFTEAMRPTVLVPVIVIVIAAIAVLFVRGGRPTQQQWDEQEPAEFPAAH